MGSKRTRGSNGVLGQRPVAGAAVLLTGYRLLLPDWRGALLAWLTLVWVANVYMSLFGRLRLDIKRERVEIKAEEQQVELKKVS